MNEFVRHSRGESVSQEKTIALLLSTPCFEDFFEGGLGLTLESYLNTYRNDFSWYYCDMFLKYGWHPIIYIPSKTHSGIYRVSNGVQVRMLPLQSWFQKADRIPVWRTKYGRYASQLLNTLSFKKQIMQAVVQDKVDILYVQEYWYGRYDLLAKWFGGEGKPLIVGADHGGSKKDWLLWKKRKSFSRSDLLTSQTAVEVEEVRAFGGRAVLLPNPVDIKFFSPVETHEAGPKKNKTVITVGRFNNSQKRTTDLIEAFRYMGEDWHLDIYGVGPDKALLEQTIQKFGLESKVTMKGFVSDRTQMRNSYRDCAVFCLPSAHEGLPMVALEAMSCGCAVVVTDIRALETLVTNNVDGIKVPVGNPQELAKAIQRAHDEAPRLGAAARKTIIDRHSSESFMVNFAGALGL